MSDRDLEQQHAFTVTGDSPGERRRKLLNDRPRVQQFAAHPYIERVEDVSFDDGRELLEISFRGVVPEPFARMEQVSILTCWLDTLPGWWGALLGDERARAMGLGSQCITVLVEVQE